jgi:hypothetical protein
MPDIAMCLNNKCPKRTTCYRFMAEPNDIRQSYADFKPNEDGKCDYYWEYDCQECHQIGYHKMSCPKMKSAVHM